MQVHIGYLENFQSSSKKILTTLHQVEDVQSYLSSTRIKWTFNIERAPWWGGLFERMVKSVERCLRKMIGQAKFNFDELHTSIVEVEAIGHCRILRQLIWKSHSLHHIY